LLRFTL